MYISLSLYIYIYICFRKYRHRLYYGKIDALFHHSNTAHPALKWGHKRAFAIWGFDYNFTNYNFNKHLCLPLWQDVS